VRPNSEASLWASPSPHWPVRLIHDTPLVKARRVAGV
jgi:hypothetical protein